MVSTRFATVDGWVNGPDRDFDYGVIFVDDPETAAGSATSRSTRPSTPT